MVLIIFLIYILLINIVGFVLMGNDKQRARSRAYRIPEKAFFAVSIAGGSLGTWIGMYFFRHKTRHWYFVVFIPIIFVMQAVLVIFLMSGGIDVFNSIAG